MARNKRYRLYVWYRSTKGDWFKLPYGGYQDGPMPDEYRSDQLSHQNDKLEAIIGESFDDENRLLLLAKWQGLPADQATWELQWRFKAEELEVWHQEKLRLAKVVKEIDAEGVVEALDLCKSKRGLYSNRKLPPVYLDPVYLHNKLKLPLKKKMLDGEQATNDVPEVTVSVTYWQRKPMYGTYGSVKGYSFDIVGSMQTGWMEQSKKEHEAAVQADHKALVIRQQDVEMTG